MKLLFLIEKLQASDAFREYITKNPSAYFFAGFFVLDLQNKNNQYQLDYSDASGSVMTFTLNGEIESKPAETMAKIPLAIKDELKIDIDSLETRAVEEAKKKGLKISKIMAILHNSEGKVIWNLTCMQGLNILKLKIDTESGEIIESSELNMMDFVKKVKKD